MEVSCQCTSYSFPIPHSTPSAIVICHCNRCKQVTGSAFMVSAVYPFFPSPTPATHPSTVGLYSTPTSSGGILHGYFCKGCGNRLIHVAEGEGRGGMVSISAPRIKGFDWRLLEDREMVVHYWTREAVVPMPEGVRQFEEQGGGGQPAKPIEVE